MKFVCLFIQVIVRMVTNWELLRSSDENFFLYLLRLENRNIAEHFICFCGKPNLVRVKVFKMSLSTTQYCGRGGGGGRGIRFQIIWKETKQKPYLLSLKKMSYLFWVTNIHRVLAKIKFSFIFSPNIIYHRFTKKYCPMKEVSFVLLNCYYTTIQ